MKLIIKAFIFFPMLVAASASAVRGLQSLQSGESASTKVVLGMMAEMKAEMKAEMNARVSKIEKANMALQHKVAQLEMSKLGEDPTCVGGIATCTASTAAAASASVEEPVEKPLPAKCHKRKMDNCTNDDKCVWSGGMFGPACMKPGQRMR